MSKYRELLLGCGARREKDIARFINHAMSASWQVDECHALDVGLKANSPWQELTTLDNNPDHAPDIVFDLNSLDKESLFSGSYFDEIHAYEVLEHIGMVGDYRALFRQFAEFHRWLKPNGLFCATCPSWMSPWAWGDPSHTRVLTSGTLVFLSQRQYREQVGVTPMSDFRSIYQADFEPMFVHEDQNTLAFVLRAVK